MEASSAACRSKLYPHTPLNEPRMNPVPGKSQPPGMALQSKLSKPTERVVKLLPKTEKLGVVQGKSRFKTISRSFQETPASKLDRSDWAPNTTEPSSRSPPCLGMDASAPPTITSTPWKSERVMTLTTPVRLSLP